MALSELAHLQLLAEIDALVARLQRWADAAPQCWPPAETCQALVRRLAGRANALRIRLEAPLVVATLGGTGTGKTALVNALAGAELLATGRQRPTTLRPTLICRPGLTPEMLGIDPANVEVIQRNLPALADLVLLDCPDPDTTEEAGDDPRDCPNFRVNENGTVPFDATRRDQPGTAAANPAALRRAAGDNHAAEVPQCAGLRGTGCRGRRARLVFVQTHADQDQDIRDDWHSVLSPHYSPGQIFLVDSLAALAEAKRAEGDRHIFQPEGQKLSQSPKMSQSPADFAALRDLLTRQLAGAAAARIRRANFLNLADQTLEDCRQRLDQSLPPVEQLQTAIDHQRADLAARLAQDTRAELLASRRSWENRLLGQVTARWGLSPFAMLLRIYQGFGTLVSGALLYRARTPAQLALSGAVAGARSWHKQRQERQADQGPRRALASCWDQTELRAAGLVLAGYAAEAGFARQSSGLETVAAEAELAGLEFAARVAADTRWPGCPAGRAPHRLVHPLAL